MTAPRTLPRRANKIRALAADMASKKLTEVTARQVVSDRISYALAAALGGLVARFLGWPGLAGVLAFYSLSAWRAYRRYRALTRD